MQKQDTTQLTTTAVADMEHYCPELGILLADAAEASINTTE